jgi:protein AaeX
MLREAHLCDVLYAPIVAYCVIAIVIFIPFRWLLGRIGLLRQVWHAPLFELAVYVSIVSLVTLFLA